MDPAALVQPNAPAAPPTVTPNTDAAPAQSSANAKIPPDLLKNPAFQGLMAGQPGAVSANIKTFAKRPEAHDLIEHKAVLAKAGMGFYKSLDGQTGVVFNMLYVHPDEIKQADVAGKLSQIAPPFDDVHHAIAKSGLNHPSLDGSRLPPTGFKSAPMPVVPQAANAPMPGPPASAQRKLMTARVSNMSEGSPTSGPVPGAGRLLNQVLKPVL